MCRKTDVNSRVPKPIEYNNILYVKLWQVVSKTKACKYQANEASGQMATQFSMQKSI